MAQAFQNGVSHSCHYENEKVTDQNAFSVFKATRPKNLTPE
jgi:hypothetical protein